MNIGRYLRGEHLHVGTSRTVYPPKQPPQPPSPDLKEDGLWDSDPNCQHDIRSVPGGGVKCSKCRGWFCY